MSRLGTLLLVDGAGLLVAGAGAGIAIRGHRRAVKAAARGGEPSPAAYGLRIAGTMIAAFGLAAALFATTYALAAG